jgi:hypothetical protein
VRLQKAGVDEQAEGPDQVGGIILLFGFAEERGEAGAHKEDDSSASQVDFGRGVVG